MADLISIIIPVFNRERLIGRCLDSILSQTYSNIEVIVVDDGSTDNSYKCLCQYKELDARIHVLQKENAGVSSARLWGLKHAKGKYVAFVDSDDFIERDMYEIMYNSIRKDCSEIAVLMCYTIKSNNLKKNDCISNEQALQMLCELKYPTSVWAGLYPRQLAIQVGFDAEIHFFEDFYFNFLILKKIKKVSLVYGKPYHYECDFFSCNSSGLNEKRISCLKIIPRLIEESKDCFINESAIMFAISHFLICNVLFLNFSNVGKYGILLQKECRKYLKSILFSKKVPIVYKILSVTCSISPKFTTLALMLKKKRNV